MATNIDLLSDKKIIQYPLDLGSSDKDAHGQDQHYVIFKINTDEKTTGLRDDKKVGDVVTATRVGTGVNTMILAKNADPDAVKQYGAEAAGNEKWHTMKGMRRLDRVIVLPMPMEHTVSAKMTFNEVDQTLLTRAGDILNQAPGALASEYAHKVKNWGLAAIFNTIKSGSTSQEAMNNEDHTLINPKKEIMFQGFGYRSFAFSYLFAPKSLDESQAVKDIIETFRYYALPEIAEGKANYIFPSEFEISFMQGQKDNPHIPKITTAVLESINVNYMPKSVWSVLPNGAPVAISISMQFKELELVDRKRVFNAKSAITSGY